VERFDAVIIGGGPAGATAAILLASAGWSVAVVEQKAFPRRKVCGEYLSTTNWPLLTRLGIAEPFLELAGPPVTETAIFAGQRQYRSGLPSVGGHFGRALSREKLDLLLIERAAECGAQVFQPARCMRLTTQEDGFLATIESQKESFELAASVAISAHGSWEIGRLPTQRHERQPRPSDWLAFKAHFTNTNLPIGLMPLLSFADGYGGMVHCDDDRASLSCCIRRHRLETLPREHGDSAGDAVLQHILKTCPILRPVLDHAELDDSWLAAGAIQPGIRSRCQNGIFTIGNAAGEAHPVVAEGISMAMQSAWLLAERLKNHRDEVSEHSVMQRIDASYSAGWRRAFAPRIYAALAIAQWASRPNLVRAAHPLLATLPGLISWGARLSGKSCMVMTDRSTLLKDCYQA
jgi:flavin-dependent dehydrogenase